MPCSYSNEAYNEVMTWTADTKIKYAPNRKSGKSYHRYKKYMVSTSVGQTLKRGSYGLDLLFDHEKGLLWRTGGPTRRRPPTMEEIKDKKAWSPTDIKLAKMYAKWKNWKATFSTLEKTGMTRHQLKEMNSDDPEGSTDSIMVACGRRAAQAKAKAILKRGTPITDDDVLSCLQLWGFQENTSRLNVTPAGQKFVYSDTIGLQKMMTMEKTLLTRGSRRYPEFTRLIVQWLTSRLPADMRETFRFTSININKNYAGRIHRDGNNAGPSLIKAFGNFKGGELNYFHSDKGGKRGKHLPNPNDKNKATVNIKDNLLLFDGNRAHYVNAFKGERYSLVFFSLRTWNKVPPKELKAAAKCGIVVPKPKQMARMKSLLAPSGDKGYRVFPAADASGFKRKGSSASAPPAKRQR